VPYDTRFTMPSDAKGVTRPWYIVAFGPVAVVLMSTERSFSSASPQLRGLEALLSGVDRAKHPWLLFGGHRPMYVDSVWESPAAAPLQTLVEPLFLKYRVDLALWGHHHSYQRSCAMAHGKCVAEGDAWGTVHAIVGTAGYEFSDVADPSQQKAWVKFVNNTVYGFAAIEASASKLHFEFLRSDGAGVLDEFTLTR
jgi:hypothetical protein